MNSNIPSNYYFNNEIFNEEKIKLFKKVWHFVGFKSDLLNENDFITIEIANIPIVIQNMKGEIKAFLNICSHRFAILQTEKYGNRPLVCSYHGWAYDYKGVPSGIPKKPLFKKFSKDELCEMKLEEFQVDFCGNLCFISLDNKIESLKNYIGDFYSEIEKMSFSLGEKIDVNSMNIQANWKIIVENTLESYHVGVVHPETLAKLDPSGLNFHFNSRNSSWESTLNIEVNKGGYKKINDFYKNRKFQIEGYKHILIFPNLLISTTHGISYNFSIIEPIEANSTKFTSIVFTASHDKNDKNILIAGFEESLIKFNRQVFKEDKDVCELVQKGVTHTKQIGKLSDEEERVHHFQECYIKLLNNDS